VHVEVRRGSWDGANTLHQRMRGVGRSEGRRHHMRDESVDEVKDEGGVEEDSGDEVGRG